MLDIYNLKNFKKVIQKVFSQPFNTFWDGNTPKVSVKLQSATKIIRET